MIIKIENKMGNKPYEGKHKNVEINRKIIILCKWK